MKMSPFNIRFAARLHHVITVRDRCPTQLAHAIGVDPTALQRSLSGRNCVRMTTLAALCVELDVDANWLIGVHDMTTPEAPSKRADSLDGWLP